MRSFSPVHSHVADSMIQRAYDQSEKRLLQMQDQSPAFSKNKNWRGRLLLQSLLQTVRRKKTCQSTRAIKEMATRKPRTPQCNNASLSSKTSRKTECPRTEVPIRNNRSPVPHHGERTRFMLRYLRHAVSRRYRSAPKASVCGSQPYNQQGAGFIMPRMQYGNWGIARQSRVGGGSCRISTTLLLDSFILTGN